MRDISGTQKAVLMLLADSANDAHEAWPSAVSLAADACMTDRAVRSALNALERRGLIAGKRDLGRATRWILRIGEDPSPEVAAEVPAAQAGRNVVQQGAELGSGVGRNVVPGRSEPRSDRTPKTPKKNPHGTPTTGEKRQKPLVLLPPWLPEAAWQAWCQHRRGKRWTAHAQALSIRTLADLREQGHDPQAIIEQSIAAGWTGLFPLRRSAPHGRSDGASARRLQHEVLTRMFDGSRSAALEEE